jgi:hypothetical protein
MISRVRARLQNVSAINSCGGGKEDPRLRDERTAYSGESIISSASPQLFPQAKRARSVWNAHVSIFDLLVNRMRKN